MAGKYLRGVHYRKGRRRKEWIIEACISAGANSIVYQAGYGNTLMPEHSHIVLIKELYPLDSGGMITRNGQVELTIPDSSMNFYEDHRRSFYWEIPCPLMEMECRRPVYDCGGWHFGDLTYDFFYTPDKYTAHRITHPGYQ